MKTNFLHHLRSTMWQPRVQFQRRTTPSHVLKAMVCMAKKHSHRVAFVLLALVLLGSGSAHALPRELRVAVDCNLPPYQFLSEDGTCVGMHIEMLESIAKDIGYSLRFLPMDNGRSCMEALASGNADLVLGVVASSETGHAYTDALSTGTLCMIAANRRIGETGTRRAALSEDTTRNTLLSNLSFSQYLVVGNQRQLFDYRKDARVSALIGIKESLVYQLDQSGSRADYSILRNYLDTINYTLAVRKSDRELLRDLNTGIARFKTDTLYAAVYGKWIVPDETAGFRTLQQLGVLLGGGILALLVYGWFTARMRRLLQQRVSSQTQQIQASNLQLERQLGQIQDENDLRNRIIKYSPSAMILFDSAYHISLMNKRARALAGLSDGVEADSVLDLPVFREILAEAGADLFATEAAIENRSIRIHWESDYTVYRYTMHQVLQYGEIKLILLSVLDTTKEDKAQQAAFEKEKSSTLNRVVAGIAHEIRNPLQSISVFAKLIGSDGENRQVQESFAQYVPREIDRIDRLIQALIHYVKPAARHSETVNLQELMEDSLILLRPTIRKNGIVFQWECNDALFITADRDQMKQILINLLMNSIEAIEKLQLRTPSQAPRSIRAQAFAQGREVFLRIRDEGVGMTTQEIEQCTEPFFTTKQAGTGLGLALCKQYVGENGGVMTIQSAEMAYTEITLRFGACEQ